MAPGPDPKASPSPKCRWSWLLPRCGWPPLWFCGISKLTDGPLSRSQRLPQAQNVLGAGFSHAAAGALAGFMWVSKLTCGWPPLWFYGISKLTDGPRSRSQRLPQAQNVVGAGFSHAPPGPLSGFMGFQN